MTFTINDMFPPPGQGRPTHPDMDRVMEIVLEMKAISQEYSGREEEFLEVWRKQIDKSIDFDVLAYQATQVAMSILGIETGKDYAEMQGDPARFSAFVTLCQSFYDGFLLGVQFEQRGGHRDKLPPEPTDGVSRTS
jgi:5'-deoxynucleotidase YfbR-like HD superfamily hydrolase